MLKPIPQCEVVGPHSGHDVGVDNETVLPCPGEMPEELRTETPLGDGHPLCGATRLHEALVPAGKCPHCDYIRPTPMQVTVIPKTMTGPQQIRAQALAVSATLYSATTGTIRPQDVVAVAREFEAYITGSEQADAEAA